MSEQPAINISNCTFVTKREPLGSQVWRWLRGDKTPAVIDHADLTINQANPPCTCNKVLRGMAVQLEGSADIAAKRLEKLKCNMVLSDEDKETILIAKIEARIYKKVAEHVRVGQLSAGISE